MAARSSAPAHGQQRSGVERRDDSRPLDARQGLRAAATEQGLAEPARCAAAVLEQVDALALEGSRGDVAGQTSERAPPEPRVQRGQLGGRRAASAGSVKESGQRGGAAQTEPGGAEYQPAYERLSTRAARRPGGVEALGLTQRRGLDSQLGLPDGGPSMFDQLAHSGSPRVLQYLAEGRAEPIAQQHE